LSELLAKVAEKKKEEFNGLECEESEKKKKNIDQKMMTGMSDLKNLLTNDLIMERLRQTLTKEITELAEEYMN
jgi:Mg2+/Co2+ transporter CorB